MTLWHIILGGLVTGVVTLLVALLSGGLAVERYKKKLKEEEDKKQGDSNYKIALLHDSAAMVDKLLPQIDRLFTLEERFINEKSALSLELAEAKDECRTLRFDLAEAQEEREAAVNRLSRAEIRVSDLTSEIERLNLLLKELNKNFQKISFQEEEVP
jgi:chromosome segregation ATPase